ncbi:hypothetical protein E2C01_052795 [Portunus trituberculatus]|uniref:Uncharacterized protein n=1 Tax=Portunus trituberculatus TaxID=210409 RepID=A0A5B7GMT0_PORTR|nr:hypothetical protein [Portunus trituberculatus]
MDVGSIEVMVKNCDGRGHRKRRGERKGVGGGGGGVRGVHAATKVRVKVRNTATKWYYPRRFHYVTTTTVQSKAHKMKSSQPMNAPYGISDSQTPSNVPPVTASLFST